MRPEPRPGTIEALEARFDRMEQEIRQLQQVRNQAPVPTPPPYPLIFHWPGSTVRWLNVRNGPGLIPMGGTIYRIDYRFDTAASVTVRWELDGSTFATHTVSSRATQTLSHRYDGGDITAIVTAEAGSAGLTAFVFLR